MKIDINKQYRTRDGRPVRILCVDQKGAGYPVVALILDPDGEEALGTYTAEGGWLAENDDDLDLVEVSPWDDFEVDEPVMVRSEWRRPGWQRLHFAGVLEGMPYCWEDGRTSWTTTTRTSWNECRRPTEEELKP